MTITNVKNNLSAQLHGGTLNKVRNIEDLFERAANTMLSKIDPIDTMRTVAMSSTIYDDVYNYALPSDFKKIIDLYPQAGRGNLDSAGRRYVEKFDLTKGITDKTISIEGSEGSKFLRVNWRSRVPKVLNALNGLTDNGTWSAVGTATGLVVDDINYITGGGSIRFDSNATGDGIQNTTMTAVDLTDEDEVADLFTWFYVKNSTDLSNLSSVSLIWGNDLTTKYWTGVAQTTQADGTAFKVGWNQIKVPWSTATETGTVDPATIDSAKITFATVGAISNLQVDNITVSIGKNFDIKYYSKYLLKNTSGVWISKTTSDDDTVVLDNDAIQIYLLECLVQAAHQIEATDSVFDLNWANQQLDVLYRRYTVEHPSMSKKAVATYSSGPSNGRW